MWYPLSVSLFALLAVPVSTLPGCFSLPISMSFVSRAVWSPSVTQPGRGDVWKVGSAQIVTWDAGRPPAEVTSAKGKLLLGYLDSSGSEHLDVDHPLAEDFELSSGNQIVIVPYVEERDSYVIALLGDSGNISPTFTISA